MGQRPSSQTPLYKEALTNYHVLVFRRAKCKRGKRSMVWRIHSKICSIGSTMASLRPYSISWDPFPCSPFSGLTNSFSGFPRKSPVLSTAFNSGTELAKADETHFESPGSVKRNPIARLEASGDSIGLTQGLPSFKLDNVTNSDGGVDLFGEMKHRFLSFKKHRFLEESEHFRTLAEVQSPKFMVIACADSRVCPSNILGFQPGEAFMIRNVANLVPPLENGPSETNAALEFAVNTLEVENILVIGHSSCAGIQALMSMQDDVDSSSFVAKWVVNAKVAKSRTESAAANISFDQQCRHCEKESINCSLLNLLTYPWIEHRVRTGLLSIHGGYYDFLDCTFEKWTLDFNESSVGADGGRYLVKDAAFWC
ncbi:hypothetical protein L1049_025721 [Liquidambar formosana]|uniref:carbonic anhydrase n=1 Tax=Liquidambar formosana TaxID=63359 RepID=A0AAP0NBT3_LIQFO